MTDIVQRLHIRGLVQGVGYRWSMVREAERLGVRGWVRNRRDGSVEAWVAGKPRAVERLIEWARSGPRGAAVAQVEVLSAEGQDLDCTGFEQRPTA